MPGNRSISIDSNRSQAQSEYGYYAERQPLLVTTSTLISNQFHLGLVYKASSKKLSQFRLVELNSAPPPAVITSNSDIVVHNEEQ
ncbi:hypothetical protein RRG08_000188 [Elysia crispata]|uniref:Uncharacterized protein n=1 Tax=Elysia crispata TaxID=231223 RepID=A0AAE1D533_9GAST|nr:hypothetical protein RRG08_000188 [Elysia crispata]